MKVLSFICFILSVSLIQRGYAQSFANGDLNGSVNFVSVPTSWTQIPDTDPICQANAPAQATVDILDALGPNQVGGVAGNPQSGNTFCSGLHGSDNATSLWHEGIMQNVNGFTPGNQYSISFYQAVVKQQNMLDPSGSWSVYIDGVLAATTAPSNSNLTYDDVNLIWECRTVTFTATSASHDIKFIPLDDDPNLSNDPNDPNGGLRMGIDNISFVPTLDPTISPEGPLCLNSGATNLTAVDPGGVWTGNGITDANLGTFDPSVAGIGTHDVVYTLAVGCSFEDDTLSISVVNNADAGWTDPSPLCEGDAPVDLDNLISGDLGGTWSGNGVTGSDFDPSSGTSTVTYAVGSGSCQSDSSINITVDPQDDPGFFYPNPIVCENEPNPSPTVSGLGGGSFTISPGGSIDAASGAIDLNITSPGIYLITYTTNGACPADSVFTVEITTGLDASFISLGPFCENDPSQSFIANEIGGEWSASCGTCIDPLTGEFNPSTAGPGVHNIAYTLQGACGGSSNEDVEVYESAQANFAVTDNTVSTSEATIEFTNQSTGADTYLWTFGDGESSTALNPSHEFESIGEFWVCLEANNPNNCPSEACMLITVEGDFYIYVPNTFIPNGNGLNDEFFPVVTGGESYTYELLIFDRWGQLIFETEDLSIHWDGTDLSGAPAKSGVFVWKLEVIESAVNVKESLVGHVNLIR
jgi:gliding motility-associated-like protein